MTEDKENKKSPLNSVKIQVREAALEMREFNVDDMAKATGCKKDSVETEIRRLVNGGYLTTKAATGPHSRRGKPSSFYRLVDDEEKVRQLIGEVKTFRPHRAKGPQPQGRNYQLARQFLDRAAAPSTPDTERTALLNQAENLLAVTWADEGGTGTVSDAFIQYEQGRLLLRKKEYDQAEKILRESEQTFARFGEYAEEREKINQHLISAIVMKFEDEPFRFRNAATSIKELANAFAKVDMGSSADYPLQGIMAQTLKSVAESSSQRHQLLDSAWERVSTACSPGRPTRHEPWPAFRSICLDRQMVPNQDPDERPRIIRSRPKFRRHRRSDPANVEIEIAVRGPIAMFGGTPIPVKYRSSRGGKLSLRSRREAIRNTLVTKG